MHLKLFTAHSHRLKLLLLIILLLTSGTLILARFRSSTNTAAETQRTEIAVEAELVTVTPTGFEPGEITRPQGRFMLAVDNRSGLNELDLYLERETGGRVNVGLNRNGKLKWREILDLPSGHYILRATNDESWRCNINLTPR